MAFDSIRGPSSDNQQKGHVVFVCECRECHYWNLRYRFDSEIASSRRTLIRWWEAPVRLRDERLEQAIEQLVKHYG